MYQSTLHINVSLLSLRNNRSWMEKLVQENACTIIIIALVNKLNPCGFDLVLVGKWCRVEWKRCAWWG